MTPWTYEGLELPANLVDGLFVMTLPFDHPSHAVLSKRAEHYRDPFDDYMLPRMMQRLFRILRTFSAHAAEGACAEIADTRIESKPYGKTVWNWLKTLAPETNQPEVTKAQPTKKKKAEDQLTLFPKD